MSNECEIPQFPELTFEEEWHLYYLNGLEVPSVTTLMKPLSSDFYSTVDPEVLNKAAKRGTAIHNAVENYAKFGILNFLWFWGMKNADETGLVKDADLEVLSRYLYGCGEDCQLDMGKVVQALVDTGWIDVAADGFYIHDWDTWQEQWYKLQKNRRLDAERKRKARQMEREAAKPAPKTPEPEQMELPVEPEAKRPAKLKPDKKSYAEFVKMSEANYDRLVKLYGKAFADACIVELDNYKGARGKTYKDDYRAILCWVVDRVKEKKPGLLQQGASESTPAEENPFREWGEQNG